MTPNPQQVDRHVAQELVLFIENDYQLYKRMYQPIVENYARKKIRGVYNKVAAIKGVVHLVEEGRKKYLREVGSLGGQVNMATKIAAAKDILSGMEEEIAMKVAELKGQRDKRVKRRKT